MKKLNFNFGFNDLNGRKIVDSDGKEISAALVISNTLLNHAFKEGTAIKKYDMALKIYNDKEIEVDEDDFGLLKNLVIESGLFVPIIAAQLEKYLNSVKE